MTNTQPAACPTTRFRADVLSGLSRPRERLPARELIVCARLLRSYTFLRSPDSRLKEVSVKLGYAEPARLSEQLREWTGYTPKDLRHAVEPTEFVRRLVERLRHADVEDEEAAGAG